MTEAEFRKMWDRFLVDIDGSTASVARDMDIPAPNLWQKIRNQTIRYKELADVVERYGYTIEIHKKE